MKLFIFAIVYFALLGCSTMSDIVGHKEEGTSRIYAVNADQAWAIAKLAFRSEETDAIEEHREEGYMLTSTGIVYTGFSPLSSWGGYMGAWIDPLGPSETKVTVLTKRRATLTPLTPLLESTFHRRFEQAVSTSSPANRYHCFYPLTVLPHSELPLRDSSRNFPVSTVSCLAYDLKK